MEGEMPQMNKKILVTYASRAGSTASIATAIGKTLVEKGLTVDVRPIKEVNDLSPYRAVVAGSAIQGGKWLPEAMQFIHAHRAELQHKPFAAFLVCITLGLSNSDKYRQGIATWLDPVRILIRPVSEGLFAGTLDFNKVPITLNTLLLRIAVAFGALPRGDHRDWNAVQAWANSLPAQLL
jgi:menaquinone-dependent protoporphyrinogen oxidase